MTIGRTAGMANAHQTLPVALAFSMTCAFAFAFAFAYMVVQDIKALRLQVVLPTYQPIGLGRPFDKLRANGRGQAAGRTEHA